MVLFLFGLLAPGIVLEYAIFRGRVVIGAIGLLIWIPLLWLRHTQLLDNLIVSEIEAQTWVDQSTYHERLAYFVWAGMIICPIPSAFRAVYPEVDAVTQPVVIFIRRFEVSLPANTFSPVAASHP
jgi:hypothetical protein